MRRKPLTLIIDTNLLFEAKRLEDLPWEELQADTITLLITRPVLREIDKHKKGTGRTKKRALDAAKRIRDMLEIKQSQTVIQDNNPRVILERSKGLRFDPSLKGELDKSITDDHLVGLLSAYIKAHPNEAVYLFTDDGGPADAASDLDLPYKLIPSGWRRPARQSDEAKMIDSLEHDLKAYRNQEPKFEITLNGYQTPQGVVTLTRHSADPLTKEQINALMAELETRRPMETDFTKPGHIADLGSRILGQKISYEPASDEDITAYKNEAYPAWLSACRRVFETLHEALAKDTSFEELDYAILNTGSRPAEQVKVKFRADGDIYIIRHSNSDEQGDEIETEDLTPVSANAVPSLPSMPRPPLPRRIVKRTATPQIGSAMRLKGMDIGKLTGVGSIVGETSGFAKMMAQNRAIASIVNPLDHADPFGINGIRRTPQMDIASILPYRPPPHEPEGFYYKTWPDDCPVDEGALTCDLWRHQKEPEHFGFEVHADKDKLNGGSLLVEVHAQNLTQPKTMRTKIQIEDIEVDVMEAAEHLIRKVR